MSNPIDKIFSNLGFASGGSPRARGRLPLDPQLGDRQKGNITEPDADIDVMLTPGFYNRVHAPRGEKGDRQKRKITEPDADIDVMLTPGFYNRVHAPRGNGLKLMTHVVAGYPDLRTSEEVIQTMVEAGVDLIEIQIPFSDPMADGPTIAMANQKALDNGIRLDDCFGLAERMSRRVTTPLLFMTYANIPFRMGFGEFIRRSRDSGISGLIVPDLPFDQCPEFYEEAKENGCAAIPVVSPGMSDQRLEAVLSMAEGFVYTTLRVGITGVQKQIETDSIAFLETLRRSTTLPLAAGFGISSLEMIRQLQGKADAAVMGSYIIDLLNRKGIDGVRQFLSETVLALRQTASI